MYAQHNAHLINYEVHLHIVSNRPAQGIQYVGGVPFLGGLYTHTWQHQEHVLGRTPACPE